MVQEPTALKRNVEITGEANPYRLSFESQLNLPTINIDSQAPTTAQAVALANAAAVALQKYVAGLENEGKIPAKSRVTIRHLGSANGAVVNGGISKSLAALVFVAVFMLWCVLLLVGSRFRDNWRASALLQSELDSSGTDGADGGHGAAGVSGEGGDDVAQMVLGRVDGPATLSFHAFPTHDEDDRPQIPTRSLR